MKTNKGQKNLGKALAIIGAPMLIIGIVATAVSSTELSLIVALVGMAFAGLAFILCSDVLD